MSVTEDPNQPTAELRQQADTAYRTILNLILRGELSPSEGDPSSEAELGEQYGFEARMAVRMALAILASEGLIAQRPRWGFWVIDYSAQDLEQIQALLQDTEEMVQSFLPSRMTEAAEATLTGLVDAMNLVIERAQDEITLDTEMEFAALDTEFWMVVARVTDYLLAARHIRQWRNIIQLYRVQHRLRYTCQEMADIAVALGDGLSDGFSKSSETNHIAAWKIWLSHQGSGIEGTHE